MTYEDFFIAVAKLTLKHRVHRQPIGDKDGQYDFAWVSPKDLGNLLDRVDKKWEKLAESCEPESHTR